MGITRHLLAQRRLSLLICAAALLLKLLVPAGYMPSYAHGHFALTVCTGVAPSIEHTAMPAVHGDRSAHATSALHGSSHDDSYGKAEQPCAFLSLASQMLATADPVLHAAAIAFVMARSLRAVLPPEPTRDAYLRPPCADRLQPSETWQIGSVRAICAADPSFERTVPAFAGARLPRTSDDRGRNHDTMACGDGAVGAAGAAVSAPVSAPAPPLTELQSDTRLTIGEVVVTAPTMARSADNVLTSVDILGGDIAQRQSADDAWELFARLPGVVLTDFNQGTTSGRFSIRGFSGEGEINAVKLLIDGVPSNDNSGGMPFIDMIAPLDIAGIELVRGTSDPRWGLHNIAGNANIVTRTGGTYVDARALAGAFGTIDGQVSAGLERGGFSQNYLLSYRRTDGFRDHADLDRLNLAGKWFYDFGATRVGAIVRRSTASAEEPGYLSDADAYTNRRRSYPVSETDGGGRKLGQYALHLDSEFGETLAVSAKGYANSLYDDRYVRFSAAVAQQRRLTDEWQYGATFALHYHPRLDALHALMIEAGGDVQVQDNNSLRWLTNRRIVTSRTRDQAFDLRVYGGYLQAIIEPTAWLKITPAWRLDRAAGDFTNRLAGTRAAINDYGTISQPKLSVALVPMGGVTLYANYGRTFQVGVGAGAYLVPPRTADVAASINEGYEGGIKLVRGRWLEARVAYWQQTASGELKRRLNDPSGDFDNLGKTRRRGIDLQLDAKPVRGVAMWGSYSYQTARIVAPDPATPGQAGNDIDHVPRNVFSGGVDVTPDTRTRLSLWGNGQSGYELNPANSQGRFGDYVVVNAEVAFRLVPQVELSAQIKNLANERYEYVWFDGTQRLHAPADPRALVGAVRLRF